MQRSELVVGESYHVRLHGTSTIVRLDAITKHDGYTGRDGRRLTNATTRYECTNLKTGRKVTLKSAEKFLRKAQPHVLGEPGIFKSMSTKMVVLEETAKEKGFEIAHVTVERIEPTADKGLPEVEGYGDRFGYKD